ncbi:hypothetical protein SAMN02745885_00419 [Carboxydocella sporoproducens DSM 16521]|uniref:Uncharacterized protein n=2 Tax=Carboxydocella TaxID=178898 RepID=A0A1T4M3Z3_9FIRM|nr:MULTISPECIES: hypothetical protein [Carboxydocella]AVX21052.1 hypothetical protein CFE_1882 [Carboxydocella thermautotrophica]AVX31472.1 hypothetical protein CTH_1901 [Carboxydocella thermautotrophica]GAW28808.1 quinate 5-dehydrogenase [Carboxydocella sp. ULO1]SJZ61719.1 hypothetical protein SAMN02745885_00419 [Carboxydocella sporoproducens DSM 16521]
MKKVVSISLGSPAGDFCWQGRIGDEFLQVERRGAGGDIQRAAAWLRELDGQVTALALGGVNLAYQLPGRSWPLPEGQFLARQVRQTPLYDGSDFKASWDQQLILSQAEKWRGSRVLLASALDRPWLAQALLTSGADLWLGDAWLALGLPLLFPGLKGFQVLARLTMPGLRRLPLRYLYPQRQQQEGQRRWRPLGPRTFDWLAGDSHLLQKGAGHWPQARILASTVRPRDLTPFAGRLYYLYPCLAPGLSPGANLWEAIASALSMDGIGFWQKYHSFAGKCLGEGKLC